MRSPPALWAGGCAPPRAARVGAAGELAEGAVLAGLLGGRLGDAELVDARAHDLQGAVERVGLVLDGPLRLVDLHGQVHAALEVEPAAQGHAATAVARGHRAAH